MHTGARFMRARLSLDGRGSALGQRRRLIAARLRVAAGHLGALLQVLGEAEREEQAADDEDHAEHAARRQDRVADPPVHPRELFAALCRPVPALLAALLRGPLLRGSVLAAMLRRACDAGGR